MVNISWTHSSVIGKVEVVTSLHGKMFFIQKYIYATMQTIELGYITLLSFCLARSDEDS